MPTTLDKTRASAIALALVTAVPAALASNPAGLVAVVTKVELEPSAAAPERAIVHGAFGSRRAHNGKTTRVATLGAGYAYFTCPDGKKDVCKLEWADLAKAATTQGCVSFGSASYANPKVRKAGEKPADPEPYPIELGVAPFDNAAMCEPLRKLLAPAPAPAK